MPFASGESRFQMTALWYAIAESTKVMAKLFVFVRLCVVERFFVMNSIHGGAN